MKLKNLFYLLLALPLVFAACGDLLGDDTPTVKKTKLTVTKTLEEFDSDGGAGTISYTFENAPEGATVSATCEADWVINLTVAKSITYEVVKNTSEEARETKIVISYEDQVFEVAVKQEGKPASTAPVFTLTSASTITVPCELTAESIEFTLENPIEGVNVEAKANQNWISICNITENAIDFIVATNEGEAREAIITATYGLLEFKVTVQQAEYSDNPQTDAEFIILGVKAEATATDTWDIVFTEDASKDALGKDVFTRLTIKLAEANTLHVTDGTYTMADGSIVAHNPLADETGNSYYRYNSKGGAITDATLTVKIDKENEKASLKGHFIVGDKRYPLEWNGEVSGFMYKEIGDEGITEWTSFTTRYGWDDCYIVNAKNNDVSVELRLHELGVTSSNHGVCPSAGEYFVGEKSTEHNWIEMSSSFGFINGHNLASGVATVVDNADGTTTISFDIVDELGVNWKGSYTGNL